MTVLLENKGVYRGGSVGRPKKCTAKLYADRIDVTSPDGAELATFPLAGITKTKASGFALMLKGDTFNKVSIEFMTTGKKMLLVAFGVIPLLIAMFASEGRTTALAWNAKIGELRK